MERQGCRGLRSPNREWKNPERVQTQDGRVQTEDGRSQRELKPRIEEGVGDRVAELKSKPRMEEASESPNK